MASIVSSRNVSAQDLQALQYTVDTWDDGTKTLRTNDANTAVAPSTADVTIANGGSLSGAIDLAGRTAIRLLMPAAWTAAVLTLQFSPDGVTYNNVYDSFGTEYTIQAAASRAILLVPADFLGVRYLKLRSGTAGAAVNQGADRAITVVSRPVS